MRQIEAVIVWTPRRWAGLRPKTVGQIVVVPVADEAGVSKDYVMRCGSAPSELSSLSEEARIARMFINFHTIVVRDEIDPQLAHSAFLAIDEYRSHIAPDTVGAEFQAQPIKGAEFEDPPNRAEILKRAT